jgi:hypothetical protein
MELLRDGWCGPFHAGQAHRSRSSRWRREGEGAPGWDWKARDPGACPSACTLPGAVRGAVLAIRRGRTTPVACAWRSFSSWQVLQLCAQTAAVAACVTCAPAVAATSPRPAPRTRQRGVAPCLRPSWAHGSVPTLLGCLAWRDDHHIYMTHRCVGGWVLCWGAGARARHGARGAGDCFYFFLQRVLVIVNRCCCTTARSEVVSFW